ncbi:MAG TPA: porin [Tepidisphaeraceae bacterium]|jgi:hypothetical protein|nr:porin [Tepidisphaeraceae bacterium]
MLGQLKAAAVTALVVGSIVAPAATATAADATTSTAATQDLSNQIDALRKQIDALQAQADQRAATATIDAVVEDADRRSAAPTLQATSVDFTGGYRDGKFTLQSADGKFSLSPTAQLQFRNVTNISDDVDGTDTENGFEIRRAKIGINGNLYSKDLTYEILFDVPRNSGNAALQFAWAKYKFAPSWAVRVGQFGDPLGREQTGSSRRMLAAERSLLNDLLIGGDNPVQGASLIYAPTDGKLRSEFAITDGTGQLNTNFRDVSGTTPDTRPDFGLAGRAEYQIIGKKFKGYEDFTALKQTDTLLVAGAGLDFTQNGDNDLLTYTVDLQYENARGFNAFGAIVGRYATEFNAGTVAVPNTETVNDIGFVLQAGQLVGKWAKAEWEVFGRYDFINLAAERVADPYDNQIHEITVGTNAYWQGHNVKGTIDLTYLPNGSPVTSDGNGVLQSADAQFVLRAQLQLAL